MNKILLDTDIFSEILKGKHIRVIQNAHNYYKHFNQYTISIITVLEIIKGFHKTQREELIQRFLKTVSSSSVEILTLNIKSAELTGRIYADLERVWQPIGRADPMIAAITLEKNLMLATGNFKHYQRIQNLGYSFLFTV